MCAALNEYKEDETAAILKYGTIDTWDVSVIRDFSGCFFTLLCPPNADLSKWNTGSGINFLCAQ